MKQHEFLLKWHHPGGSAQPYIEEFDIRLIPHNFTWDPARPTGDLQFVAECTVCAGIFPRIHETVTSSSLNSRNADDQVESLLDQLDRALSKRYQEVLKLGDVHPKVDKPVLTVITGAGFSAGFGLPVTTGLRQLVTQPCKVPESLLQFLHEYELNEYPLKDFLAADGKIRDFEYLLTIWEGYRRQLGAVEERQEVRHLQCLRRVLEHIACHLYRLSWSVARDHGSRLDALAAWLKRAKESHDVRFVTFNYDVVLETLCQRAGFPFVYAKRTDASQVPIRKLHGSINWQSYAGESACPSTPMSLLYESGGQYVYAFPDVSKCPFGSSGEPPVLVPPMAQKQYRGIYEWMWAYAGLDLAATAKLAIVGYSFPPLDVFAEAHLIPALRDFAGRVTYILPPCTALERVRHLLRNLNVTFVSEEWEVEHFEHLL